MSSERFEELVSEALDDVPTELADLIDNCVVLVEVVKLAEDRSGDVVVRVYEPFGTRSAVLLEPGFAFTDVAVTDLLEEPDDETAALAPLDVSDRGVGLTLGPFQIVTLRFGR